MTMTDSKAIELLEAMGRGETIVQRITYELGGERITIDVDLVASSLAGIEVTLPDGSKGYQLAMIPPGAREVTFETIAIDRRAASQTEKGDTPC